MRFKDWLIPNTRGQQAGMFLAGAAAPFTFQRTLMPRGVFDQAAASGIIMAFEYAVGALVQDSIEAIAVRIIKNREDCDELEEKTLRHCSMLIDMVAIGFAFQVKKLFRQRDGELVGISWARTVGDHIDDGALAGLSVALFQEIADKFNIPVFRIFPPALPGGLVAAVIMDTRRRRAERAGDPEHLQRMEKLTAILMSPLIAFSLAGVAVIERTLAGTVSKLFGRIFREHERIWRPLGHASTVTGIGFLTRFLVKLVYDHMEEVNSKIEPAFDEPPVSPLVSGGPGSLIPWESLSLQGRRYVSTYIRMKWLERVMGEPAKAEPIRVFSALNSGMTDEERVDVAIRELERTGAFDRPLLIVMSPTGTGYVNCIVAETAEYLTNGNMASIALQYSKRPSAMSLDKVPEGVDYCRLFLKTLNSRLEKLDPEERPRVVLFGESLGAWTSQDAFEDEGTDGLLEARIGRALWIGTPHAAKWKEQVLGPPRPDVDKSLVGVFDNFEEIELMAPEKRNKLRYVMITHHNDPVARFGLDLLVRRPDWLGDPEKRPLSVPKTEFYKPFTTFILTLIDMKNSEHVIPGQLEANGHDYRGDLPQFVREVFDLPCTDWRLDFIRKALREYEVARREWIDNAENHDDENSIPEEYELLMRDVEGEGEMQV
ncbi:MAG: alpha/beta-hydrolase family protein [Actinobacteria bacterium]|nr:alpha/beta-hydrolase family protein [Actinomycetota bacterium]